MKNFSGSFVNGNFVTSINNNNNDNNDNKNKNDNNDNKNNDTNNNNDNNKKEFKTDDVNTYSNFTVSNTISFGPPPLETNTNTNINESNSTNNNTNNNENTSSNIKTESPSEPQKAPTINPIFTSSSPSYHQPFQNQLQEKTEDAQEIEYIMKLMEKLRISNPDTFTLVLQTNKKILDLVESNSINSMSDIKNLDSIFKKVEEIDIDYLFWCSHKSIKISILNHKNLNLVHFFIIKKGYKLNNKSIYHNFINEYLKSLNKINFLETENEIIEKYVAILQMIINQGECDVNDNEFDSVQNSPLHYAIVFKQFQFFIVLIKYKKTDLNKINANGDTPLDFAVENLCNGVDVDINKEFCKLLIMFGAKCNNMQEKYKILFESEDDENENEKNKNDENENEINTSNNKKNENNDKKNERVEFSGGNINKKKIVVSEDVACTNDDNEEKINIISKNKEDEKK